MATERQVAYLKKLLADVGESISPEELGEFAELPIKEASERLSQLEQKRESQVPGDPGSEGPQ